MTKILKSKLELSDLIHDLEEQGLIISSRITMSIGGTEKVRSVRIFTVNYEVLEK